jgi:hypothetical protein
MRRNPTLLIDIQYDLSPLHHLELLLILDPAADHGLDQAASSNPARWHFPRSCSQPGRPSTENALLRQQLILLNRQVKRPQLTNTDRIHLVVLSHFTRFWQNALLIVQPDTLLRWHWELFRLFWQRKSKPNSRKPRINPETVQLISQIAEENRQWGAERIRGELLKLGIQVCKRTIQKYIRRVRKSPKPSQTWATFIYNQARQIWACDFTVVHDLLFRPLYIFVLIELATRRVVHAAVTRGPSDAWTAQPIRESTPHPLTLSWLDSVHCTVGASVGAVSKIPHP